MFQLYDYARPECEFLARSLAPNKIEDNYLMQFIVSCPRESEVSANFEWQMLFQCLNDFPFLKFISYLRSIYSIFISLVRSLFYSDALGCVSTVSIIMNSNKFHFVGKTAFISTVHAFCVQSCISSSPFQNSKIRGACIVK